MKEIVTQIRFLNVKISLKYVKNILKSNMIEQIQLNGNVRGSVPVCLSSVFSHHLWSFRGHSL